MSLFQFDLLALDAIKTMLMNRGLPATVRIEIRSTGCCDASLGLAAQLPEEGDFADTVDGLTIAISPKTHHMVGDIAISYVKDPGGEGFVIRSERPLNEWAGFGKSCIRF